MKEVFDQIDAEVDQNAVDKKCNEIQRKNLLIKNENLIAECLSKDVFYTATYSVLTVSRFSDMHDAYTVAQKRIAKLEAGNSNLTHKIKKDDHDEMIKHFSKLEVEHLNLKLKYQHLKEHFGNKKSVTSSDAPAFESVFVIENLKEQLQGRGNTIRELKEKISCLQAKHSDTDPILDFKALVKGATAASGLKPRRNTKKNRTLRAKSDKQKVEDHLRINKSSFVRKPPVNKVWRVKQVKQVWQATGKLFANVGYQWKPTGWKFTLGEQCPLTRFTKSKVVPVIQIVLLYLDSGCSKHMMGNRSWLMNFVKKFIGTVRFGNDHFGAIMGYGDYVIGDSLISKVYYVEGLGHNLFSVRQFCDSGLEVEFRKHSCYVRTEDGMDLLQGSRGSNLYTISVEDMMKSSPICLLLKASKNKSWLWHRRLNHLNFGTINDLARKDLVRGLPRLKFEKDHLCSAC
ncbi:integrase, catalytic region, zinc finger, CCHC-type containing protein [Tanacetum coccineum]